MVQVQEVFRRPLVIQQILNYSSYHIPLDVKGTESCLNLETLDGTH